MQRVWDEMRAGWDEARWTLYFSILLLPALAIAVALTYLVEGKLATPPTPVAWFFASVATLVSIYWAGLWDSPSGRLLVRHSCNDG